MSAVSGAPSSSSGQPNYETLHEGPLYWRRDRDKWQKLHCRLVEFEMAKLGVMHAIRLEKSKQDQTLFETITITKELLVVAHPPEGGKSIFHLANGRKTMHLSSDKNPIAVEWINQIKKVADTKKEKDKGGADDNTDSHPADPTATNASVNIGNSTAVVGAGGVTQDTQSPTRKAVKKKETQNMKNKPKPNCPLPSTMKRPQRRKVTINDQQAVPKGKKFKGIKMTQVRAKQLALDAQAVREGKKDKDGNISIIPSECQNLPKLQKSEYPKLEPVTPLSDDEDEAEDLDAKTKRDSLQLNSAEGKENLKRLEEIQKKGGLPDLKEIVGENRILVRDGKLRVQIGSGGRRKEERHFILFNDLFLHVKKTLFDHDKIEEECIWPLELVWVVDTGTKIKLIGPTTDQLTFTNKHDWLQTFTKAINDHVEKLNTTLGPKRKCHEKTRFGRFSFADGSTYRGQWVEGRRQGRGVWKSNGAVYNGDWKDDKMEGRGQYLYPTGDCYFGYFSDGKPHGIGTLTYSDRSEFIGNWSQGVRKGYGVLKYENGDVFKGTWKGDKIISGKLKCKNRLRYEGSFLNNLFENVGILMDPNDTFYEGEFKLGLKSGKGLLREISGAFYEGQFENNMRHGIGCYTYASGSRYIGQWVNDIPHGVGRMEYCDGTIYQGEFLDGLRSGKGKCSYPNEAYYDGDWLLDRHNGEGEYRDTTGIVYKGTWVAGLKQGIGNYLYSNGATYQGPVRAGLYEGKGGTYTGGEGDSVKSFVGTWSNGTMLGSGIVTFVNGDTYEGHLKNNSFHGDGVFTTASGIVYDGKWEMGVLTGKTTFTFTQPPNNNPILQIQGTTVSNYLLSNNARPLHIPPNLFTPHFLTTPILSQAPKKNV